MAASRVVLLSSVALSLLSGVALAQQSGPNPRGPSVERGPWGPAAVRQREEDRQMDRAKALHEVLGIQPSQESAFAAFTATMRPPEWRHDGGVGPDVHGDSADAGSRMAMTTPERLDHMKAEMDRRFAAMRDAFDRRAEATKALYAVLDARQRAVMDALPELTGHGGGGDHRDGMGPRGPMGSRM